jgi:phosphatidate cytidylyltransferase
MIELPAGRAFILFLFLMVVAADIGAFLIGRRWGRVKLAPRVSPGKTWEGVLGGVALAAVVAVAGSVAFGMPSLPFLGMCVLVIVGSIVGDLTESLFKRFAGLKDSGALLPGHGGILDRIDSMTAAAPLFLLGLHSLGLRG